MKILIEGDAKEIALLAVPSERLIDSKIENAFGYFANKFKEVSERQPELFLELLKERFSAESVPDSLNKDEVSDAIKRTVSSTLERLSESGLMYDED